jgi:hypothetical protein
MGIACQWNNAPELMQSVFAVCPVFVDVQALTFDTQVC